MPSQHSSLDFFIVATYLLEDGEWTGKGAAIGMSCTCKELMVTRKKGKLGSIGVSSMDSFGGVLRRAFGWGDCSEHLLDPIRLDKTVHVMTDPGKIMYQHHHQDQEHPMFATQPNERLYKTCNPLLQ
jgi:hypothetical protein